MSEGARAVFLSYASQDAEAALRICDVLRAAGIAVWFDQSELRGGEVWDASIRRQIRECALFLAVISEHTDARAEGYFRREWKLAVDRTDDMAEDEPFLLPVVVDATPETTARVPAKFRHVQWTRLPDGTTTPAFVERIARLLAKEPVVPRARTRQSAVSRPKGGALQRSQRALLVSAAVGVAVAGYLALNKSPLSKRSLGAEPASAVASLPGVSSASPISEKSIAVLPFADMSEKKDQEYFSDGLAEELLDLLAKTPGLHVIARTSSFSFKGKSEDIPTIARKLNVANILEGSVRKSGDRLRVTTQLIRASNGEPLWSETYDRELRDVFAVQDEIAAAVVGQLKLKLAPMPRSAANRTSNIEAYDQYMLGREFSNRGTLEGEKRAIEAYRRAIALDSSYTAPYDGLAAEEFLVADETGDAAGYERARAAAAKAVELGPDDPNSYAARGLIRQFINWDWAGAQADFDKAIALDPGDARFQARYGILLATLGRLPEAVAAVRKAIELDPLGSGQWGTLTSYFIYTRDFPAAREASRRALEISPESSYALKSLGELQLLEGNAQDALATFNRNGIEAFRLYGIAMSAHALEDSKASQQALDNLVSKYAGEAAYQVAEVYAWRGEKDKAFEWLERAYAQRDGGLLEIKFDPLFDPLRGDPPYKALLRKMKLSE